MRPWGIVLAGGRNTRLGQEKASLEIGGHTLVELALLRLTGLVGGVILAGSGTDRGSPRPVGAQDGATQVRAGGTQPVLVRDLFPGRGPLGGIHAGLKAAPSARCMVLACDLPFVSRSLLAFLLDRAEALADNADVVVPRPGVFHEPLCAVYSRSCLPAIEAELVRAERPRVISFYPRVRVAEVGAPELQACGDIGLMFFNLNTPADLERARALVDAGALRGAFA
ncbi:MAG: molybdenum cofactor guanylyltransferase [Acetobacteraceae bacterium]|nr:molybdenum cofactor guanylyltransferase [Acetobacteraceae bacterium]